MWPDGCLCSRANEENGDTVHKFMERRENVNPRVRSSNTPQQQVEAGNTLIKRRGKTILFLCSFSHLVAGSYILLYLDKNLN